MPTFVNVWSEEGGQVSKCVWCGEHAIGLDEIMQHVCKEPDGSLSFDIPVVTDFDWWRHSSLE